MTTNISVSLADADFAVMQDVAPDPQLWVANFISARIDAAVADRMSQPGWTTVAIAFAGTGGNPEDGRAVLAYGLISGAFKNAAARQQEALAEEAAAASAQAATPTPPAT